MNEVLTQLHARKSVRAYENRAIAPEIKRAILEAALQAPSAGHMTLYTILDITDQDIKDKLVVSCDHQPFIATAPMVLVFCADYRRWYDVFCQHVEQVRKPGMGDLFLAQADTLIAAQNVVVAAHSFGLGSCYIGDITENYEYHKELLKLPKYVVPTAMLVLGYPTEQQQNRVKPQRLRLEDIVHENGYDASKPSMAQMLALREGKTEAELAGYLARFCKRKWNSDFSIEMTRSCEAMVLDWTKE